MILLSTVSPRSDRRRDLVPLARVAVAVVLIGHGLIHLLGLLLLWQIAEPGGLGYTDVRPESGTVPGVLFGFGWLIATMGFAVAGMMVSRKARHWEWVTVGSVVVSVLMLLPELARRWLIHSIEPGTPLWTSVELSMGGQIKLRSWRPFVAHQAISPTGYVWTASTSMFGLPIGGFDRYTCGSGKCAG